MSISINIDGKKVKAKAGMTVLQAAKKEGIYIPTLCDHPFLEPSGNCRMCIVKIEGMRGFPTACTTPIIDGMVVKTDTPELKELRRNILKLTLSEHPYTCLVCDKRDKCDDYQGTIRKVGVITGCQYCPQNGKCELQNLVEYLDLEEIEFPITYRKLPVKQSDPFFDRDYNLCILCGRCVRICNDIRKNGTLTFINRGDRTIVGTAFNKSHLDTGCEFCGACVDVCPTGALYDKKSKWEGIEDKSVISICPYCSVGCAIKYNRKGDTIIKSIPAMNEKLNVGQSCMRGRFGIIELVHYTGRLQNPMIKDNGKWIDTSWDKALSFVAEKFSEYKKKNFGCIVSPHNSNEDMYLLNKLTRKIMKSENIAVSSFFDMNDFKSTLQEISKANIPIATINDIDKVDVIVVWGGDISVSHPIVSLRIQQAQNAGAKLLVVDNRKTKLAENSDFFMQLQPNSDRMLITGLLKLIKKSNPSGKGLDKIRETLNKVNVSKVIKQSGISEKDIETFISFLIDNKNILFIYGSDVVLQENVKDTIFAISNLALSVNNGKILPVVGESNLRGYFEIVSTGSHINEIIRRVDSREIKCLYVAGELPELKCLDKLEFLVVQSLFPPEWMDKADVILPTSHLVEREGSLINFEGRVQRMRRVIKSSYNTKPDWWITNKIVEKISGSKLKYKNTSEIFNEIKATLSEFKELTFRKLGKTGKYLSSVYKKDDVGSYLQFNINSNSRVSSKNYPYTLKFNWNLFDYRYAAFINTITGIEKILKVNKLQINPEDAEKIKVKDGDTVYIKSSNGFSISRTVEISTKVKNKILFTWFGKNDFYKKSLRGNVYSVKIEKGNHE